MTPTNDMRRHARSAILSEQRGRSTRSILTPPIVVGAIFELAALAWAADTGEWAMVTSIAIVLAVLGARLVLQRLYFNLRIAAFDASRRAAGMTTAQARGVIDEEAARIVQEVKARRG